MMKRILIVIALLTLTTPHPAQQTVSIGRGFFTGKDYFEMSETEKRAYATGAINGMLVAPFFGAQPERLSWLKSCTGDMSDELTASIISNYINSDSNRMNMSLNVLTFTALKEACEKAK
jgi:hypothetical protein